MKVVSYIAHGCIFKIQAAPGYAIESVKFKCVSVNHESDWLDIKQNNNKNEKEDSVYYEVKDIEAQTILLKIEHLQERRKYQIQLQTIKHLYTEEVTIYGAKSLPKCIFFFHSELFLVVSTAINTSF